MEHKLLAAAVLAAAVAGHADAQSFEGDVSLSYGRAPFMSTDDDEDRISEPGYKVSGWAGATFGDWRVFADVNVFHRSIGDESFSSYGPEGARSYGLHFGRGFGPAYVGAFLGRNQFQSDSTPDGNGYKSGKIYGVEGQYDMGGVSFFAQLGRAEMIGDLGDNEFTGTFQRIGASATVDKLTITADLEQGGSPDVFEDCCGNWGHYRSLGVTFDYQVSERLIATVSYETMSIQANTEDNGYDEFFGVGVRVPLGASTGKRNNLTTSYSPGLAAAWASNLD
jgi:hypothetical protein